MAIPITCPGCQATFEVPEGLAGKTIRCTSCKTQLTVAAAQARSAAPLSLDNPAPPAKSAPAANGKATVAKSGARAAVAVVDDDDDDDTPKKTSPNKPASKSGPALKGAPKKRRIDDDDDDYDDDDDQPRRKPKKKSGGGSGPVIALIGGGVICLGAIVGLCVWLLGGDDSKDSAKSDGSNTSNTNTNHAGMMPPRSGSAGGPPGGTAGGASAEDNTNPMGGSGGGRPNGPTGGSAGGPPGGFSTGPVGRPPGGGLTPISPNSGGGMGPGSGRPPMGGSASGPPGIGTGTDSGMGPGDTTQPQGSAGGPPGGITRPPMGGSAGGPPSGFGSGDGPPAGFTRPPMGGSAGGPPGGGGGPPAGFTRPPQGGPPGGMGPLPVGAGGGGAPPGVGSGRPPGGPGRLGGPGRGGPGGDLGQPGGGFGGGQGDTNPPPVGANVDGYLKAKIEPFFSGAFDPEKKEFFAFSSSANRNVISTTLHRYNVAESFNKAGSFKVHHFVSRAVIDPAKGLLYAATITRPSVATLGGQTMDQTTGVGDVVVYDLDAIRSDKVKDGGDLKSVHTFGLGKKICGLELSPDGKSLFVVTTVGSGKTHKSFLNVYDTETRKPVNQPTALEAPAWTASRSSDGKFLLIMDMVEPGSKTATTSRLRVYDTAGKKIKEHSLQGIGNDLAATANGQYVAAVMSAGALKLVLANETNNTRDLELGFGWKAAAKPGYVEYSPDGKHLYVSGHPFLSGSYPKQQGQQTHPGGLDVYDVVDADSPTGLKKTASIRTASKEMVGGHFFVSPTGEYLVFQTGVVLETARIGGSNGESNAVGGGFPGGGAGGLPGVAGGGGTPAGGVGEGVPMGGLPVAGGGMPPAAGAGRPPKPGVSAGGVGPPGGPPMGAGGGGARPPLKPITPNGGGGSGGGSPGKPGGSGT